MNETEHCPDTLDLFGESKEPKPNSQCARVLEHMKRHGSITDLDAYIELGIRRLAARIYDLREAGYEIVTETEEHRGGTHARYSLKGTA